MGKSKAQDRLKEKVEDLYPYSNVSDEIYIGDLIEEQGYSIKEIADELGHKPHKMFVDIILREPDRTVAFEYHGEQHYSLVGNMTKNAAELAVNQKLDQEKSWILNRIGIPLVPIPFDMYVDASTLENAIDEAYEECSALTSELTNCIECQRLFPSSIMNGGMCQACFDKATEASETERVDRYQEYLEEQRERYREMNQESDDEAATRKAEAKARRKAAYRAYKESEEYQRLKEEQRQIRKKLNRERRERQKEERRKKKQEGLQ